MAIESCCPPKAFLLAVQNLSRATSGPEQLSSDCPRPECIRGRRSLLLHPSMSPGSCQLEWLRSTFQCIPGRCSLLLHPNMPPDSVHFVRPTANSYLVSHLTVQENPHGRCGLTPRRPAFRLSAAFLKSKVPIQVHFGACEEFPTAACQKCPTLFCSEGSPELKER